MAQQLVKALYNSALGVSERIETCLELLDYDVPRKHELINTWLVVFSLKR